MKRRPDHDALAIVFVCGAVIAGSIAGAALLMLEAFVRGGG